MHASTVTCSNVQDPFGNIHVIFITLNAPLAFKIEFVTNEKKNERDLPTKPNREVQNTPLYNVEDGNWRETFYFNNPKSVHA